MLGLITRNIHRYLPMLPSIASSGHLGCAESNGDSSSDQRQATGLAEPWWFYELAGIAGDVAALGRALVAITKTAHDQVEGELESIQGSAGRQLSGVAFGIGEGVGQRSESAQQFVAADGPPFLVDMPVD